MALKALRSVTDLGLNGNAASDTAVPSFDGRFVLFRSSASNMDVTDDNAPFGDVFVNVGSGCTNVLGGVVYLTGDESAD